MKMSESQELGDDAINIKSTAAKLSAKSKSI